MRKSRTKKSKHLHRQRGDDSKSKNKSRKAGKVETDDDDGNDDDIMAQLRRQRQKQQQQQCQKPKETTDSEKEVLAPDTPSECNGEITNYNPAMGNFRYDSTLKRYLPKSAFESHGNLKNNDLGIQRAMQNIGRKHSAMNSRAQWQQQNEEPVGNYNERNFWMRGGPVTEADIIRVAQQGIGSLRSVDGNGQHHIENIMNKKRQTAKSERKRRRKQQCSNSNNTSQQKNLLKECHQTQLQSASCSNRTVLLLTTSLEYCTSPSKRKDIASYLGPMSVACRARITPTQSTLEMIQKHDTRKRFKYNTNCMDELGEQLLAWPISSTHYHQRKTTTPLSSAGTNNESKWFSMLCPLNTSPSRGFRQLSIIPSIRNDCECKSYLQPTVPTFDILPPSPCHLSGGEGPQERMPHVVTITGNDALYYRSPRSAWDLPSPNNQLQYHGVRFAIHHEDRKTTSIGSVGYSPAREGRCCCFLLQNINNIMNQSLVAPAGEAVRHYFPRGYTVNDFCFKSATSASGQDPGMVAFAHGTEDTAKHYIGASILDIPTMSLISKVDNWTYSEPMCLQYQRNDSNTLMFGLRDGSVLLADTRDRRMVVANFLEGIDDDSSTVSFGSATTVRSLKDDRYVIAKGSFGSCRIFDLRRLSNSKGKSSSKHYGQATSGLLELRVPDAMVHRTKSVRCTGLAMDPTESVAIAPFASSFGDIDGVHFAMWDASSGTLLRTLNVNEADTQQCNQPRGSLDSAGGTGMNSREEPLFCELSSVVTPGYEMLCTNNDSDDSNDSMPVVSSKGSSFGLWFKTNVVLPYESPSPPPDGGGIHHMRF